MIEFVEWSVDPRVGASPVAALTALARQIGASVTWVAAQEGYVAAATRIYVLRQRGRPWATASVQRDGDAFAAMLDKRCHPPVDPGR